MPGRKQVWLDTSRKVLGSLQAGVTPRIVLPYPVKTELGLPVAVAAARTAVTQGLCHTPAHEAETLMCVFKKSMLQHQVFIMNM